MKTLKIFFTFGLCFNIGFNGYAEDVGEKAVIDQLLKMQPMNFQVKPFSSIGECRERLDAVRSWKIGSSTLGGLFTGIVTGGAAMGIRYQALKQQLNNLENEIKTIERAYPKSLPWLDTMESVAKSEYDSIYRSIRAFQEDLEAARSGRMGNLSNEIAYSEEHANYIFQNSKRSLSDARLLAEKLDRMSGAKKAADDIINVWQGQIDHLEKHFGGNLRLGIRNLVSEEKNYLQVFQERFNRIQEIDTKLKGYDANLKELAKGRQMTQKAHDLALSQTQMEAVEKKGALLKSRGDLLGEQRFKKLLPKGFRWGAALGVVGGAAITGFTIYEIANTENKAIKLTAATILADEKRVGTLVSGKSTAQICSEAMSHPATLIYVNNLLALVESNKARVETARAILPIGAPGSGAKGVPGTDS